MSHYKSYLEELTDKEVLETTNGFVTYSYPNKETVYIENIYIEPNQRKSSQASDLADQIAVIAKERGCIRMIGSVQPSSKNATRSLKVLLGYGMELLSSQNDMIFFTKDI